MKSIYFVILIVLLASCKGNTEAPVATAPSHKQSVKADSSSKDLNQTSSKSEVLFENENFTKIYKAYLDVKASLVNTNEEASATAAHTLFMLLKDIKSYKEIYDAALPFTEATSVKERRKIFEGISNVMESQIEQETIISGTIYKQYCPMAFNGKGAYWLSDSKEVRNPYFGDQMLKCGVVDRTID